MDPIKPFVPVETFTALDIRVGTIRSLIRDESEPHLLNVTVDFDGHDHSFLLDWVETRFDYEEILGKQAIAILNVEGVRTGFTGRILELGPLDQLMPVLVCPEHPIPDGSRVS
ncbi:hypothetical protein [Exiguobacterium oxidotolerans]|uniref:tRNA-binding protein n=1 Tax=Exiguobacterium oxidotolerans TaxID=223958 RepID=A0A653IE77_9BACL|nr:hypothetical protein [Exiguobacterium oxidotolerans]VWX37528.1 conserved hypothetical protein [Exiguobacterium oxidotolerans]